MMMLLLLPAPFRSIAAHGCSSLVKCMCVCICIYGGGGGGGGGREKGEGGVLECLLLCLPCIMIIPIEEKATVFILYHLENEHDYLETRASLSYMCKGISKTV